MVEQQRSPRSGHSTHSGPGFWTSPSQRTTYASYPDAWEQNYRSTLDDFKAYSFGNPNPNSHEAEQDARDPRWRIVNRQGDETSSSSSSEEEAQRRRRNTRDITPRASVVSLGPLADQQSTPARPRSHPSQQTQQNYYQWGTSDIAPGHPSESDLALYKTQSEYSFDDPGYEGGRSSYAPSLDTSEAISISSSRQSSEGDEFHAYEAFSHDANNSGLGAAMGSSSAFSVSSLRCDDDADPQEDIAISDAQMPSPLPELHAVSQLDSTSPTIPPSSDFGVTRLNSNQRLEDWHRPLGSYPSSTSSPTHLERLEAKSRSRSRSVSTLGSVSSTASSRHLFDTDKEFDMAYITSGLEFNLNNANPTDADASLDFVKRISRTATGSPSRGSRRDASNSIQANKRVESGRSGPMGWEDDPSVVAGVAPRRARAATTTSVYPSTYTHAPMTVSRSPGPLLEGDASPKMVGTVVSASGSGDATPNRSTAVVQLNPPTSSRPSSATPSRPHVLPPPPTSSKPGSPLSAKSPPLDSLPTLITGTDQIDLTALIRENEINSMDGMPHIQAQGMVKRRKSNLLSGLGIGSLGVLGIGSSKTKASALVRDMSPGPCSPSKNGRANIGFGIEEEGHKGSAPPSSSSSSSSSPSFPAAATSRTVPISASPEKLGLSTNALSTSSKLFDHPTTATTSVVKPLPTDAAGDGTHLLATSETSPLTSTPNTNTNTSPSISRTVPASISTLVSPRPLYPRPPSIISFQSLNSTSFSYDDSFARGLMVWGGAEYVHMRREWVIRMENRKDEGKGKGKVVKEAGKNKEHVDIWQGLPPGAEEVWTNFLLGKFYVSREDVYPRSQRRGLSGGVELTNTDPHRAREGRGGENNSSKELGKQKQGEGAAEGEVQGKPPQHRLIIKRLRDDQDRLNMTITQPGDPSRWRGQNGSSLGLAVVENTDIDVNVDGKRNYSLSDSSAIPSVPMIKQPTLSHEALTRQKQNPRIIIPTDTKPPTAGSRPQFDSQHPTILVHKHSKVAAFSISRQHRDRDKDRDRSVSKAPGSPSSTTTGPFSGPSPPVDPSPSSSTRLHVVMLAQRAIQESFTTTESSKKFGSVIDRHEAVRAAFSPGVGGRSREKDIGGKKRSSPTSSAKMKPSGGEHKAQVKSDGQIEVARADGEFPTSGFGLRYVKSRPRGLRSVRNSVGTRSAPVYKLSTQSQIEEESVANEDQGQHEVDGQDSMPANNDGGRSRASSQSRSTYQRTYGTLDQSPPEISNASASPGTQPRLPSSQNQDSPVLHSRSSSIFKRFLPWSDVSSSTTSSKGSSTVGSISTTQSVSSVNVRDTTSTSSMNSDFSAPFVPPWMSLASRDQHDIQRKVLGQLEHSFENVGLLPSKEKKSNQKGATNLLSRHKKHDVLSCVPVDSFFMLLPLWPAETDAYSQRLVPFEVPSIPLESRRYLLVFYKTLDAGTKQASNSSSATATDARNVLIPGFHAIARQVSYNDLQGTCIRAPEQGLSVSGPLEDAFNQMPRANSATIPSSPDHNDGAAHLSIIGSCYSRESGVEFDPEALIELDLCTVLSGVKKTLPPGMVTEQFDSEQSVTVKLTPIGSAVMEMVWVGGLALTSFSS